MKRRGMLLFIVLSLLFTGCTGKRQKYSISYLSLFDTVTNITAMADSQQSFQTEAQLIYDKLLHLHQLFDIYNDYAGMNNLKTVNDNAGIAPVQVDGEIIRLLKDCETYHRLTGGKVNVAMGSVLALWHAARSAALDNPEAAALPERAALEQAARHMDWDAVQINEEASTVFLSDPKMRLDVGAVAKGWSVQRVAETTPPGFLISVGGNVCATGAKDEQGTPWIVGITDPDGGQTYVHTLYNTDMAIVTSGDYQRYFRVGDKNYHHIIDPQTLFPAVYWRAVTVVSRDSGLADALSTALFVMPLEEGMALAQSLDVQVMWMDAQRNCRYSPGFLELIAE